MEHKQDELRYGLFGRTYPAFAIPHEARPEKILKLIERGRVSLARKTHNHTHAWLERSNPTTTETLALLVDTMGLDGMRNLIVAFMVQLGNHGPTAAALHIPTAAALAVLLGSFPTDETVPTLP